MRFGPAKSFAARAGSLATAHSRRSRTFPVDRSTNEVRMAIDEQTANGRNFFFFFFVGPFECDEVEKHCRVSAKCYPTKLPALYTIKSKSAEGQLQISMHEISRNHREASSSSAIKQNHAMTREDALFS